MIAFATNLVLVRLLSPDAFGLVSFSMILIGAFTVLQDLGVPAAIVYGSRDVRKIGGTALTINVVTAVALLMIVVLTAPWIAQLGNDEELGPIAIVLALGLVFTSLGSVQNALLIKELAFRKKFLPDVVPLCASGALSVVLAQLGFGVWSLVFGYVARSLLTTVILWSISAVRPYPRLDWGDAKDLLRYGRHVSFASILDFVAVNADYLVVGLKLGAHQLGIYTIAFVTASLPIVVLGQVLNTTTFPAYSSVRSDSDELTRLFQRVFQTVVSISIPIGILMFFGTPAYVAIALTDEWSGVIAPLQILSIFAMLRSVGLMFPPMYKAIGRPDLEWRIRLARLAILFPALYWATGRYGIVGAALSQAVVAALFVPLSAIIVTSLVGISVRQLARLVWPQLAVLFGIGLLAALVHTNPSARHYALEPLGSLVVAGLGLASYTTVMVIVKRRHLAGMHQSVARYMNRRLASTS